MARGPHRVLMRFLEDVDEDKDEDGMDAEDTVGAHLSERNAAKRPARLGDSSPLPPHPLHLFG